MKTVILQVATRQDVNHRALEAFRGKKQGSRISHGLGYSWDLK